MDTEIVSDYGAADVVLAVPVVYFVQDVGIVARWTDANNYTILSLRSNRIAIWKRQAGEWTQLHATVVYPQLPCSLEFKLSGTKLEGRLDGELLVYADTGFNRLATIHGTRRLNPPEDVIGPLSVVPVADSPPPPVSVKLGPVPAYYPDDPKYFDPEF